MTLDILLSIILVLGGSGGPSGDFDTAVSQPTATSETTVSTSPAKQKKGSFD